LYQLAEPFPKRLPQEGEMAYDENLAERIRGKMVSSPGFVEKKMFGGIGFMIHGNMACGVNGDNLIVRVGPERYEAALSEPHVGLFDMTGRPMKGWIVVAPEGCATDADLGSWIERGVAVARSLPPK
jgi:hypothetical protein